MRQIGKIRTQLSGLAAEAVQQPASSGRLPLTLADSPETYETIWGKICSNEDLDFPSMQEALSTKRCIEIAAGCTEQFDAELTNLDFPVPATPQEVHAMKLDPMRFVQSCADAASGAALSFDKQTEGYLDGPRAQQREVLHRHIKSHLEDKAARVTRSIGDAAVGIMSGVSQETEQLVADWDGERLLIAPDSAAVTLAGAVEELDAVYASHRDGPLLRVPGLFHDPGFFHNRFVEEMDLPQQPSSEGVYGSLSSLHASLLSWCVKLSAPLGVLYGVGEAVAEARSALENLLDKTRQAMQVAAERAGLAHLQCTGARVRSVLSDTNTDPQAVLAALYNDLIDESQAKVRHAAEALGWRGFSADGALPRTRETLLALIKQEVEHFLRRDAVGVLAQAMDAAFVHDGADLRNYESEDSVAARYGEVRERLEAYVRSLRTVCLEEGEISVPGEQIDEVLRRADDEWGKMHSNVRDGLRTRQENQKLREMHDQANTELNRQREQIKVLEESARQREAEMNRQLSQLHAEAAQQRREFSEALRAANERANRQVEQLTQALMMDITPLMQAAKRGDVETVKRLIPFLKGKKANGVVKINGYNVHGGTALMMAAAYGHAEVVRLLMKYEGCMKDRDGYTALMFAAGNGRTDCIKLLIEKESGMKDKDGWTALMSAAQNGYAGCVKLLVEREAGMQNKNDLTALMRAAHNGHTDCVKILLEKEACIQARNGMTALMMAARNSHTECVKLLMEKEGGMYDDNGWTALMYAAYNNNLECARLLAKREKRISNKYGKTALDIAKREGRTEIISILSG